MPYFVWIDYNGGAHPQKWERDYTIHNKPHPGVRAVNKHEITPRQWKHSPLKKLALDYPFVAIKDTS